MKLIDLLVQELPKRGGWPEGVTHIGQDYDRELMFYGRGRAMTGIFLDELAIDHRKCGGNGAKITKEQYESALADSKAVVGHDGWIQWAGGDCPVDSDAIVEVKYRKPNPYQFNNDRAGDFYWSHHGFGGDIIAYRLTQPHEVKTAGIDVQRDAVKSNDAQLEDDLNECIGQDVDIPEWNGEGLPPAGCECEARYRNADKWVFFRCVGVDSGVAFGWLGKEAATLGRGSYEFRPLRTEAERKHEAVLESICAVLEMVAQDYKREDEAKLIYEAIAAGKIPGVKLDD